MGHTFMLVFAIHKDINGCQVAKNIPYPVMFNQISFYWDVTHNFSYQELFAFSWWDGVLPLG